MRSFPLTLLLTFLGLALAGYPSNRGRGGSSDDDSAGDDDSIPSWWDATQVTYTAAYDVAPCLELTCATESEHPPMKSSWSRSNGRGDAYVQVTATHVIVGEHHGSGHSDNAGTCTHPQFLAGEYQSLVKSDHGAQVLQEVLRAVRARG